MILGITYNRWHLILAIIAVALAFVPGWIFVEPLLTPIIGIAGSFLVILVQSILIAHHLQSWNEAKQSIDDKLEEKYGSYINFQINSKDDWRNFWIGILLSWIIPLITVISLRY